MFAHCILFAIFCSMSTLVRRKKTWRYSARKVLEFSLPMTDIPFYVSCKFEMYIFKIALVSSENVRIAFLYVLSIYISSPCEPNGSGELIIEALHEKHKVSIF